ncbi:ParA family protein [Sphingobacterium cellulitidis]|uniref:AAA domain-containing protein n=1 Tax=Sphingobacterium cellulitidis TaxID=1768011 RepID=A0A8H9KSY3_9SPHI|nr:AAA family ATPase [Sphingobacterium soli]MBA8986927.1 cellulose biosynthesis protein BcsQ [Sphingobacterium soli]GGE14988.1 hypothetical protein GCM10011516_10970 [Sphingobacterium soli]
MIQILKITNDLKDTLEAEKGKRLHDFKIFIRLNLDVDIYIIGGTATFIDSLSKKYKNFNITFRNIPEKELGDYSYLDGEFGLGNHIDYGLKYRFNTLLDKKSNSFYRLQKTFPIPIITFYSYKGGMGRTTTLTSYALDLVMNHKKRVCIIDCDFEAPGYLNFFNLSHNENIATGEKNGIVEFLIDYAFKRKVDINNYIVSPKSFNQPELSNLFIVPAGNLSDTTVTETENSFTTHRDQYLEGLARLDFANEETIIEGFNAMFVGLKDKIKPDVILIDSRTGFNDVFGITALILSDLIIGFFGSSEQTKPGLRFLLDKFYEMNSIDNSNTELLLVNSILPKDSIQSESFHNTFVTEVGQYVQLIQEKKIGNKTPKEDTLLPIFYKLTRNAVLEGLGVKYTTSGEADYKAHVKLVKTKSFADFKGIFGAINESKAVSKIFPPKKIVNNGSRLLLRNLILKNLMKTLRNDSGKPALFAEDADINPATFFYREQMKKIFNKDKFLIQGFKGTGKTYLYKALRDPKLQSVKKALLKLADNTNTQDYIFIDIISLKGKGEPKSFDFDQIELSKIDDKTFYFKNFWLVYTWNSIFLDAETKLNYKVKSELQDYIQPFKTPIEAKKRFDSLIYDQDKLAIIEKDLVDLDEYLFKMNKFVFVLYDQLDNLIKPNFWRETVSPLIDYWWDSLNRFKNIAAKIFIRTDLYNRLNGTNTTRLENNIINIEWSREEVYAYFFKLIFANEQSKTALFDFMNQIDRYDETFVNNTKKYLERNNNQLKLLRNEIEPFMTSFFGKEVRSNNGGFLGKSFDWFYFNLTNADQQSISLRPFINLINGSIDEAIKDSTKNVQQIINLKYYSSRENRDNAVTQHFEDLIREDFNRDLEFIFTYLKEKGTSYKKIFLYKSELYALLEEVLKYYSNQLESKTVDDLKGILISNGIIHENLKPGENIFYFAQLYKYWLGLSSRKYEFKRK